MEYLPEKKIFFMHIPKCAGTSVRRSLSEVGSVSRAALAEDLKVEEERVSSLINGEFKYSHHKLGLIHPAHVPLEYMKSEFPKTWSSLVNSNSFALTRDPRHRFISAIMQRLKEFKSVNSLRADDDVVGEEAARVCDWLAGRGSFCDLEYIHFSRQADYIFVEGEQVIDMILPVGFDVELTNWMEGVCGVSFSMSNEHVRRQPKSWAKLLQPVARFAGRKVMGRKLKEKLYPLWVGSNFFDNAISLYDQVCLGEEVEKFISEYYLADFSIHDKALEQSVVWKNSTGLV